MINQNQTTVEPMHPADIKAALEKRGLNQKIIAKQLNISDVTVNGVIYGRITSRRIAEHISEKIGLDIETIWPGRYQNGEAA